MHWKKWSFKWKLFCNLEAWDWYVFVSKQNWSFIGVCVFTTSLQNAAFCTFQIFTTLMAGANQGVFSNENFTTGFKLLNVTLLELVKYKVPDARVIEYRDTFLGKTFFEKRDLDFDIRAIMNHFENWKSSKENFWLTPRWKYWIW